MSVFLFECNLTDSERTTITQRARSGCLMSESGHLVVDGVTRDRYSVVRVYLRGKSYSVQRHRLCYYVDHGFEPIPTEQEVSHLCHVKSCCLKDHLTLESPSVNSTRKQCLKSKKCLGHPTGLPNCVFWKPVTQLPTVSKILSELF